MSQKIKVAFILPSLRPGGAERVMSYIAQELNREIFEVQLVITGTEKDASYRIENTPTLFLNKPRVLAAFFPLFNFLKRHKPHIVISAISHLNTMMAVQSVYFRNIKFIGREVNVLSVLKNVQQSKRYYPSFLTKYAYKLLDVIICQSKDMAADMMANYGVPQKKITVINNPISDKFKPKESEANNNIPQFITVGSLVNRKGHDRILKSLALYSGDFHYTLLGDGSEREQVLSLAEKLGIKNKITHIPFTNDVAKYLKNSTVFLQGSYVEGFPNALLESCAVGTPVLAFDAPGGINEIVELGINGFIVNSEKEFADKLNQMTSMKWPPKEVSRSVFKKYDKKVIIQAYEELFSTLHNKAILS